MNTPKYNNLGIDYGGLSMTDRKRYQKIYRVLNEIDAKQDFLDIVETVPLDQAENVVDENANPYEALERKNTAEIVVKAIDSTRIASLDERSKKIVKMRFGIEMSTDYTLEEVGKVFDVSRDRVRQIEAKSLRKLRGYAERGYNNLKEAA